MSQNEDKHEDHWLARSTRIDDLQVEVCFVLNETFYRGDDNNHAQITDPDYRVPLALPDFPRVLPLLVRSSEAIGHEAALAAYYQSILDHAAATGKGFNAIRHYFWLRLWLWQDGGESISFPWYDTLSEMHPLLDWLQAPDAGAPYNDLDQGWEVDAVRAGELTHLRQGDPDSDEELTNFALPATALAAPAAQVQQRMRDLIVTLSGMLGADVWTHYRKDAPFAKLA